MIPSEERYCKRCDATTEHRRRGVKQYVYCLLCRRRAQKTYCDKNRKLISAKFKEWYAKPENKLRKNEQSRHWQKTHKAAVRNIARASRLRKSLQNED
jgi:hypothetical protein